MIPPPPLHPPLPPPPPPPPPPAAPSAEEIHAVREALTSAASILEKGRCLETELEATSMLGASLLGHQPGNDTSVDVSTLPGGVRDGWAVISDASVKDTDDGVASAAAIVIDSSKTEEELPLGSGQLSKAVHTASLAGCIQREASLAQKVKERREKEGPNLKKALVAAKAVPRYENIWLQVFDERLRQIQSYHAQHHMREDQAMSSKRQKLGNPASDGYDLASVMGEIIAPIRQGSYFSEEEVMGKYLDLEPVFSSHSKLIKTLAKVRDGKDFTLADFMSFLAKGHLAKTIAEADKLKERKFYVRFLVSLQNYLEGFVKKVSPLSKTQDVTKIALNEFVIEWKKTGGVPGWEAKPAEAFMADQPDVKEHSPAMAQSMSSIDLSPFSSAEELENAVNGDTLKAELARLGLKCGGTAKDRAKRLFMTKGTPLDHLPKKLFAKKKSAGGVASGVAVASKSEPRVDIARREAVVMALLDHLRPTLEATLRRQERRQAQTLNEREQERSEELHGSAMEEEKKTKGDNDDEESEDEDDAPIYNPKGVPLGWDGKPIPYWLFKLHGLNHFYPCEICGNESYRGRRNFELHFTEAKHAYGMKCLGIPNTKHFHGVTKIEDAQDLWKKLQGQLEDGKFKEEEYEDSHGNVLSRAAYEDLARQGLL